MRYTFNDGHLVMALAVVAALFSIPSYNQMQAEGEARELARAPQKAALAQQREMLSQQKRTSGLSIERLEAGGCIPAVSEVTGKPIYFSELTEGKARHTNQNLATGQCVANVFGETGVIDADGKVSNIAKVSLKDTQKYLELYQQLDPGIDARAYGLED